ncbi:MAG: sigma 54-interacting transcriptional regulator [Myxococcota bacterium]
MDRGRGAPELNMPPELTDRRSLPPKLDEAQLWNGLRELQLRMVRAVDRDGFLDEALDRIVATLGADRGLIFLGDPGDGAHVVASRREGRELTAIETAEVTHSVVEECVSKCQTVVWRPERENRGSLIGLGVWAVIAAPLRGSFEDEHRTIRGAVYVDFRDPMVEITDLHKQFFEAATLLVSGVLQHRARLANAEEKLEVERARVGAATGPTLEELLRPKSMTELRQDVRAAVAGQSSVIVLGESGTGKTAIAELIAEASGQKPVVRAVLGASDDLNTITSELFGHERGAFSGATAARKGVVEYADGGTLILDEILNLPPHAQQLLLDFTQFGQYRPLGYQGQFPKQAQVRIIAATNGDMAAAMREGRFRQDLWFRLSAIQLRLVPLRERREDIPQLAETYLRRLDRGTPWRLSVPARRLLLSADLPWEGNVRELEGVMQQARDRARAEGPSITAIRPDHIRLAGMSVRDVARAPGTMVAEPAAKRFEIVPDELDDSWARLQREKDALDEVEIRLIEIALKRHRGVISHAAKELDVSRTSLISRMKTLGVDYQRFRD